jgi:hypothetical protein
VARELRFSWASDESVFEFARHPRDKLYGSKKRVEVDADGHDCTRGLLSEDGSLLIPPGGAAQLYVDADWNVVDRSMLRQRLPDGSYLEKRPSTVGALVELQLVDAARLLDCVTTAVYRLDEKALADSLRERLGAGAIFEAEFAYTEGFDRHRLFLLQNGAGVWALVGRETGFEWVERATPPPEDDGDELFEDELDFGML